MKLILHIGMMKTGTTALQSFLHANRAWLGERGIAYPSIRLTDSHRYWGRRVVRYPIDAPKFRDAPAYFERHVARPARAAGAETLVVSYEGLWSLACKPETVERGASIAQVVAGHDVSVVAYVRRQDLWFESLYNQGIKVGDENRSFDAFLEHYDREGWGDLERGLAWWRQFSDDIRVRVYERGQVEDVVADFVGMLGIDSLAGARAPRLKNERVNTELLEPLRSVRTRTRSPFWAFAGTSLATRISRVQGRSSKRLLTRERAQAIVERYRDSNALVAQRYLGRDRLFLHEPRDAARWEVHQPHAFWTWLADRGELAWVPYDRSG